MKCQTSSPTARIAVFFFAFLFLCLFVFLNLTRNSLMFSPMQIVFTLFEHSEAVVARPDRPFSLYHCAKHSFKNRIFQCVAKHCFENIFRLEKVVRAGQSTKRVFVLITQCVQRRDLACEHVWSQVCGARMVLATKQKLPLCLFAPTSEKMIAQTCRCRPHFSPNHNVDPCSG